MAGVVAAQSIGEPCTQLTLNSVEYNTPILLDINGKFKKVKIGEYIDNRIKNSKKENIENHPNDTTLEYIKDDKVKVLAPTEDGKIIWDNIKAVTKHPVINEDGSSTLLKVTTNSGRTIIATKAKGFMKRVNNKIVGVNGDELKIGDYIPISNMLKINKKDIIDKWNIVEYLSKTEYLYTSEVKKALKLYNSKKSIKDPWWASNKGNTFELPYSRCDSFIEAYRGSKRTDYKPKRKFEELEDCIYPCRVTKQPSHIPEEFQLDELFGFFIGAYMAEGCCTKHHILISNLDCDFNDKIHKFCNKYSINYHIDNNNGNMKNNGYTKTLRLHSIVLAEILMKSIGTGSSNKIFPSIFLQAPDEFLKGLIDGYFSGDGTIGKSEIIATSVSKELLEGIQATLMRFNIQSSIKSQEKTQVYNINKGINAKLSYNLYINCEGKQIFRDIFNLTIKYKNDKLKSYISKEKYGRLNIIPDVVLSNNTKHIKRCDLENIKNSLSNEEDINVIQNIENEEIWYDRIIKIEEFESEYNYVYDFTTDITKNFTDYYGSALRDTFHSAGISSASQTVRGVPRIKELLSVSKNIKGPSTKVYINKGINQDREKCKEILNSLETTYIRDIISSSTIYYDPNDSTTTIGEDIEFIKIYKEFEEQDENCDAESPWLLRFEFNKNKMFDLGVTMHDVHQTIYEYYENIISCYYSDDNANKLVFRIRLDEKDSKIKSSDMITELKALEQNIIDNIIIKGIKNIKKVILLENKKMEYDENKYEFVNSTEWYMDTNGNNLLDILSHPNIDYTRTISNDVNEVYEIFGIEAARLVLLNELNEMLASEGVNYRHISLLVDTMTNKGSLLSIDRHGINRSDIGPFAKCSFEETSDMLIKAGVFGEYDKINGVSANIMLGQVAPCGTGDTEIMIDEEKLMNINDEEEEEEYNIDDNMCTDDALSFNFDMPIISKSDNQKRETKDILLTIK
jgi:DNA-directed RNA polymerase beta' subunit